MSYSNNLCKRVNLIYQNFQADIVKITKNTLDRWDYTVDREFLFIVFPLIFKFLADGPPTSIRSDEASEFLDKDEANFPSAGLFFNIHYLLDTQVLGIKQNPRLQALKVEEKA